MLCRMKLFGRAMFVLMLASGGCILTKPYEPIDEPSYWWGFYNVSDQLLRDVHAEYHLGNTQDKPSAGILDPNISAAMGPGLYPIPEAVTVYWQTTDKHLHEQQVRVAEKLADPARFEGTVWLVYRGPQKGWTAAPMTAQEKYDRAVKAARGELPPGTDANTPPPAKSE